MTLGLALALRIEQAETRLTRAVVEAALASSRAPRAFVRELSGGVGAYVRPGSPMNKVIGAWLAESIDQTKLEKVETLMRACKEQTRVELSTLAPKEVASWLLSRGYRLLGFENVLVRSLNRAFDAIETNVQIERVTREAIELWKRTVVDATVASDETGEPVDQFSHETIVDAVDDFIHVAGFDRYLARLDGVPVGGASLLIHERIAMLGGSATLSPYRQRGVQTELIQARLAEARERGAELVTVTTAPDSRSEANMIKRGFSVAYARAILVRD